MTLWKIEADGAVPRWFGTQAALDAFWQALVRIGRARGPEVRSAIVTTPDGSRYRLDSNGSRTDL